MNGPSSEKIIVTCRTSGSQLDEDGISLLIIDKDSAGLSSRDYSNVDGSKASEITLENVSVPKENLLGEEGKAFNTISEVIDLATLAISA